jgi:hypothetical protein
MKPFTINRNSWHYKLNIKFLNDDNFSPRRIAGWEDRHSNFCSYWRATMFRLFFAFLFALVALLFVIGLGNIIYNNPVQFFSTIGFIILFLGSVVIFVLILEAKNNIGKKYKDSLFVQKYKSHKSKICPMVEFKE